VITDGDGHVQEVKRQVFSGSQLGVTTIGIGIGIDVSNVYANNITVRNFNDLGNASFKQIKLS
jgi:cobalamin biosynthesis protein CobT